MAILDSKIQKKLDQLERDIKLNVHLNGDKLYLMSSYAGIRKYWSRLKDEDKDFLHMVDHHLKNNVEWKTDK
jgi:hypothetical protein